MARNLHIGGKVRVPGWEVLDVTPADWVDHVANARDLSQFADGTFDQIYASHVLEHFDYRDELLATLKEWHRVLVPGGALALSVPDLDVLARLFVDREKLTGKDRFQVMRMIFGGHVDRFDYHLVGLNDAFMAEYLQLAGFADMTRVSGFGLFDDASGLTVADVPISLNVVARKASVG